MPLPQSNFPASICVILRFWLPLLSLYCRCVLCFCCCFTQCCSFCPTQRPFDALATPTAVRSGPVAVCQKRWANAWRGVVKFKANNCKCHHIGVEKHFYKAEFFVADIWITRARLRMLFVLLYFFRCTLFWLPFNSFYIVVFVHEKHFSL